MEYDFKNLTFREIINADLEEELHCSSRELVLPKKRQFLIEDDELGALYYIRSGSISLYMVGDNGEEKSLYRLPRGWFFGEVVHFLELKRTSLHIVANEKTTLYAIATSAVDTLMSHSVRFRRALMKCSCYKTIALRYEIANFTFCSSQTRLLKSLYRDVDSGRVLDQDWFPLARKRTHYELSVDIGTTRVTVTRLIRELCREGKIRILNGDIQFSRNLFALMTQEEQ